MGADDEDRIEAPPLLALLTDSDIMRAVAVGHEWALAEVHRRHGVAVRRAAVRIVGDDTAADDVAQEVFIRVWRHPERFDPRRGTLRAYLLRDAHGRSIDLIRSEESRRRRELRVAEAPAVYAETELDEGDERDRVRLALARLPDEQWSAVRLAYFAGHTYRQVAELLEIPEGTAKSRLRRALSVIRDVVEGKEMADE